MSRAGVLITVLVMASALEQGFGKESVRCVLDGRTYEYGESWHPVVPPFGAMSCVNCSCTQTGEVDCRSQTCPKPACAHPKIIPNQCCPTCEVAEADSQEGTDQSLGCQYYGNKYNDGDKFPSNKTALQPTKPGQCVLCVCAQGRVLCHLKSCPAVRCRDGYISVSNDCCPRCKDCLGVDGIRQNGTTWTPTVPPFGLMKCVECRCLNGRIECSRKKCPDERKLHCKRPRKVEGQCCKACRKGRKRRPNRNPRPSSSPKRPLVVTSSGQVLPSTRLTQDVLKQLCMPKRTDRLVYKTNTSGGLTLVFDTLKKSRVEVLSWTIRKGRLSSFRVMQPARDFRKQVTVAEVIGSTNKRHYKKFKKRLTKHFKRCERKRSCRLKHVMKLLKKLRTKKTSFSPDCASEKN